MTDERIFGHTKSGCAITDAEITALADEAEAGYDVDQLIARRRSEDGQRSGPHPQPRSPCALTPSFARNWSSAPNPKAQHLLS